MSRTKKTAINSFVGIGCSLLSSLLSFVLNAVFIRLLGLEYAGVNSLFGSILMLLNIAELGVCNAILYRLYKFISNDDTEHIELYLSVYKKVCIYVGIFVSIAGLCCIPFLESLVKEQPSFPESLWSLYIIVLATSVIAHALDYRSILLIAKQDRFIVTIINYTCMFLKHGLQIVVLLVYKNIYFYLLVALFTSILSGFVCGLISQRRYHLQWSSPLTVDKAERKSILKDVGSLATFKFCRTLDATIDTFLISKFVAVATTAIYGSINILLSALNEVLGQFNDGMIASIGDLNASGEKKAVERIYYQTFHFTFLVYGTALIALAPFLNAFTNWWIGYTLPDICIYIMLINFMMYGFGMHVATFRNSIGLFVKGWKRPVYTAIFNCIFSILLVLHFGLLGTLLGTLIARLLTLSWYDPMIVAKHGWNGKPYMYYVRYAYYFFATIAGAALCVYLGSLLPEATTFISLVWHGVLYAVLGLVFLLLSGIIIPDQVKLLNRFFKPIINKIR